MNFPVHTEMCLSLLDINRINLSASLSSCRFCIFAVTLPKKCVLSASYSLQFARKCISSSMTLHTGHSRSHMLVLGFVFPPRSTSNVCELERNLVMAIR